MKASLLFLIPFLFPIIVFGQWLQIGNDIDGESTNDHSGFSVCISADGNTVIIGARNNSDSGSASGQIRVYQNIANVWQQKGSDINGIAISDKFGSSVSISADGNIIAAGAPDNNANGFESGHVRAYKFQGTDWVQIGNDIAGEAFSDHSGFAISLSDNGNRLAIGAPDNGLIPNVGSNFGQVRVFENQNNNWVQIGSDIDGENPEDNSGFAVSLNGDGSIVAIGAPNNTDTIHGAGHVRVYSFNSSTWVQIGNDIDGVGVNDKFGGAVSLNNQGNILAVGALDHNGTGQVRVFENIANNWVQIGSAIDGEAVGDKFGCALSLDSSGSHLAVGAYYNNGTGVDAGHTRVFRNQSGFWQQIDSDIDGEAILDRSGYSVSLCADGSKVAIGAYLNDGNGSNSGHVRIYSNSNVVSVIENHVQNQFTTYPNPVQSKLYLQFKKNEKQAKVELYAIHGSLMYSKNIENTDHLTVDMTDLSEGIYILKIQFAKGQESIKIIKQN